jgi:hypothetical protein
MDIDQGSVPPSLDSAESSSAQWVNSPMAQGTLTSPQTSPPVKRGPGRPRKVASDESSPAWANHSNDLAPSMSTPSSVAPIPAMVYPLGHPQMPATLPQAWPQMYTPQYAAYAPVRLFSFKSRLISITHVILWILKDAPNAVRPNGSPAILFYP